MAASGYVSLFAASLSSDVLPCHRSQSPTQSYCPNSSSRALLSFRSRAIHKATSLPISPRNLSPRLSLNGFWNGLYRKKDFTLPTGHSPQRQIQPKNLSAAGGIARAHSNERVISLVVAVALPFVAGVANALLNNPNSAWYKNLKKPSFNPPDWLFGVAWGILYPVMGLASWLVWSEGGFKKQLYPLAAYTVQLIINLLWPVIFFRAQKIRLALIDISALVVAVGITIVLFKPVNPLAAYLLIPYFAWVAFATFLNYKYLVLNGSSDDQLVTQTA